MDISVKKLKFIARYSNRPSRRAILKAVLLIVLTSYILYHFLQGHRGLLALLEIKQTVEQEKITLATLEKQHAHLQRNISLLRPSSLDLDLLDERARMALNVAAADEIIVDTDEILATSQPN